MLMPAGVLIVLVLGAIAADLSLVHNGKRTLIAAANSAANDAVTAGLDVDALRRTGGRYTVDPTRARRSVDRALAAQASPTRRYTVVAVAVDTDPDGRPRVSVTLRGDIDLLFARALPGLDTALVEATGTAIAQEG
jgi:hypothetical protein